MTTGFHGAAPPRVGAESKSMIPGAGQYGPTAPPAGVRAASFGAGSSET